MSEFTVDIQVETLNNGVITKQEKITISDTVDSITMRMWVDYQLYIENKLPSFITDLQDKKLEEAKEIQSKWTNKQTSIYIWHLSNIVSIFCDKDLNTIMNIPLGQGINNESGDSLNAVFSRIIHAISDFEPDVNFKVFEWKGCRYTIPKRLINNVGQVSHAPNIRTVDVIHALQVEHIYNAKNEEGKYVLQDRKYHNDIGLVASLARKVTTDKDGNEIIEQFPLDDYKFNKRFQSRVKLFQDLPMSIALNVSFFLIRSKRKSLNTLTSRQLLMSILLMSNKQNKQRKIKESSINGDG